MNKRFITIGTIFCLQVVWSQDEDLDLDAMWDNTVWNEIEEVTTEAYEVEKVTAVAGVRGAEAEDEALSYLYYRRSMKGLALIDLQKAYGKLQNTKDKLLEKKQVKGRHCFFLGLFRPYSLILPSALKQLLKIL